MPPGWLKRGQLARVLGTSLATVRRKEDAGTLHPIVIDGVHYFSPAEVDALRASSQPVAEGGKREQTSGEIAAAAFECFERGRTPRQVVIELKQDPQIIRNLFRQYAEEDVLLIDPQRREIERWLGVPKLIPVDLLPALRRRVEELVERRLEAEANASPGGTKRGLRIPPETLAELEELVGRELEGVADIVEAVRELAAARHREPNGIPE